MLTQDVGPAVVVKLKRLSFGTGDSASWSYASCKIAVVSQRSGRMLHTGRTDAHGVVGACSCRMVKVVCRARDELLMSSRICRVEDAGRKRNIRDDRQGGEVDDAPECCTGCVVRVTKVRSAAYSCG